MQQLARQREASATVDGGKHSPPKIQAASEQLGQKRARRPSDSDPGMTSAPETPVVNPNRGNPVPPPGSSGTSVGKGKGRGKRRRSGSGATTSGDNPKPAPPVPRTFVKGEGPGELDVAAVSKPAVLLTEEMEHLEAELAAMKALAMRTKGLFEWVDGPLVTAMRSGEIILLDELSLAEDAVLERLNSVLEPGRSITLAEKGGEGAAGAQGAAEIVVAAAGFR